MVPPMLKYISADFRHSCVCFFDFILRFMVIYRLKHAIKWQFLTKLQHIGTHNKGLNFMRFHIEGLEDTAKVHKKVCYSLKSAFLLCYITQLTLNHKQNKNSKKTPKQPSCTTRFYHSSKPNGDQNKSKKGYKGSKKGHQAKNIKDLSLINKENVAPKTNHQKEYVTTKRMSVPRMNKSGIIGPKKVSFTTNYKSLQTLGLGCYFKEADQQEAVN